MLESVISDIVDAVADSEGVKSDELDIVLADYIDPDALEQLANHGNSTWRLEFELPDHVVTVTSNGEIFVDDQLKKNWRTS